MSDKLYNPATAAQWLSERLNRTYSRVAVQFYIKAGNLPAENVREGKLQPQWVIRESDLIRLADQADEKGRLPAPTGGWPQNKKVERRKMRRKKQQEDDSKKANGLAAIRY